MKAIVWISVRSAVALLDTYFFGSTTAEMACPAVKLLAEQLGLLFPNLLLPEQFGQTLDTRRQMTAVCAERQVELFRGSFLRGRGVEVGTVEGTEQFLIPRMNAQSLCCIFYFGL